MPYPIIVIIMYKLKNKSTGEEILLNYLTYLFDNKRGIAYVLKEGQSIILCKGIFNKQQMEMLLSQNFTIEKVEDVNVDPIPKPDKRTTSEVNGNMQMDVS